MNRKLKAGLLLTSAALLFACNGPKSGGGHPISPNNIEEYRPVSAHNSIDFYAIKDNRKDPNCFYMGNGDLPPWTSKSEKPKTVPVIITSNFNGQAGYQRLDYSPSQRGGLTADAFQNLLDSGNINEIEAQISNLADTEFSPHQYTEQELAVAGNVGKAQRNPLDIVIPYYANIVFILRNSEDSFAAQKSFRVAVGVAGGKSPFYGPPEKSRANKVMKVKYLSLPQRSYLDWDYIKKRNCTYYYELTLDQETPGIGGDPFQMVVILDPDGEGDDGPPDNDPPMWP